MEITPRKAGAHASPRRHSRLRLTVASTAVAAITAGIALAAAASSPADADESVFTPTTTPVTSVDPDTSAVELGMKFSVNTPGTVTGVRYYGTPSNSGTHTGSLWSATGQRLATATFPAASGSGWRSVTFATGVHIAAGTTYVASYLAPHGQYADDQGGFSKAVTSGHITAPKNAGVYAYGSAGGFPTEVWNSSNYYVDVTFVPDSGSSSPSPSSSTTPTVTASPTGKPTSRPTSTPTTSSPTPTHSSSPTSSPTTPVVVPTTSPTVIATTPSAPSSTAPTPPVSVPSGGCAAAPSSCGYPDATNTGVTPGTQLTDVPGTATSGSGWTYDRTNQNITVNGDGTVLQNLVVHGSIEVYGANVTIKNVHVINNGDWWAIGLHGSANTTVDHVQVSSDPSKNRLEVGIKDVTGSSSGTKILHSDISGVDTGIQVHEGLVQDNYVHDLRLNAGDHVNGFSSNGSTTPLTIDHNTILDQIDQTDAISLFQDFGLEANRTVSNNLIAGGSYTLYAGGGSKGISHDIHITGNRFSRIFFSTGGVFGPVTAFDKTGAGNTWSANVWDDTSAPVNP